MPESEEERRRECIIDPSRCGNQNQMIALTDEMVSGMGLAKKATSYTRRDLERAANHILRTFRLELAKQEG